MSGIGALREPKAEIDPFTAIEARTLIAAAQGWEKNFVTVLLMRGLRPNEALALKWKDIDFARATLSVRGTVHRNAHGGIGLPKTKGSERTIEMGSTVTTALEAQRASRRGARVISIAERDELVFPSAHNTPMDLNNFRLRNCKRILKGAGIERYRTPYQCRHTFATLALEAGQYRNVTQVAAILGHDNIQTVMDYYVKPMRGVADPQLGALIDAALNGLEETA